MLQQIDLLACLCPSNPHVLSFVPHMRQIMHLVGTLDLVSVIRGGPSKFRETGSRTLRNRVRRCTPLWLTLAQQVNAGLVSFGRAYGSLGGASEKTKTRAARSYLERWAGIRDGMVHRSEAATSDSQGHGPATSSSPTSFSTSRPGEQRLHVFGRRYLVPTLRIPSFPVAPALNGNGDARRQRDDATAPSGQGVSTAVTEDFKSTEGSNGANSVCGRDEEEEEELRVFHWMRDMLQGNAARGLMSIMPAPGSSVVLDLAAVSQDGSPHGKPARRAGLSGLARAVKASGYIPVGVCNTSQDVLTLAAEMGLPEVMMMEIRSKALAPCDASGGAAVVRRPRRRNFSEISSNELETASRSSASVHSATGADPCATSQPDGLGETPRNSEDCAAPADAEEPLPVRAFTGTTTEALGETAAAGPGATVGEEHEGEQDRSEGDSSQGTEDAARPRETMVYHGSVRSGQQVFAEGTSLVIMGAVSSGGEVMADGDIHVYGSLRGRALAGLSGNTSSMIFATKFDAELVGIADAFTTCHDPESLPGLVRESPTNVSFSDGQLVFRSIG